MDRRELCSAEMGCPFTSINVICQIDIRRLILWLIPNLDEVSFFHHWASAERSHQDGREGK